MTSLERRIAAATRRCQRIARLRNAEQMRKNKLRVTDPNYWALADVIDNLEIQFAAAQKALHDLEGRRQTTMQGDLNVTFSGR